jgi:intracellular septation protein
MATPKKTVNPLLKLVLEMGPLVVFFFANSKLGILQGTLVFMAATLVALAVSYSVMRTVPVMPLVSGAFVLVFGGLTVLLEDDLFIKLKPTIVNLCFAGILLAGLLMDKLFIKLVLETALHVTDRGWHLLTRAWIGFFIVLAVLNEAVWRNFPTDTWVKFKVFGVMPLTLVFSMALVPVIMKHTIPEPKTPKEGSADHEADKA